MFSATFAKHVRELADIFLKDPVFVIVGGSMDAKAVKAIKQHVTIVRSKEEKERKINDLLKVVPPPSTHTHRRWWTRFKLHHHGND